MPLSTYAGNAVLNALLNNTALQVASAYASLHSGDPGLTGLNELSGSGYGTRPAMAFDAPDAGATSNTSAVVFPAATGNWTEATYGGLFDAATAGNFLFGAALTANITVLTDEIARFAAGAFDLSVTGKFGLTTAHNVINALLRNTELVVAQAYASLHSGDPGTTGANELSGNNYSRTAMSFGAANAKSASNDAAAETGVASGAWAEATHMGLWTADVGGTFLWGDDLATPRTVGAGKTFLWGIGAVTVTIA